MNVATATNATTTAATTTTSNPPEHFVLSAQISDTSGESGIIIDDEHPIVLITKGFEKFQKGKVLDIGASYARLSFVCCIITYIPYAIT